MIATGLNTCAIVAISDTLRAQFGNDSLRHSILAGIGFYALAAVLLFPGCSLVGTGLGGLI